MSQEITIGSIADLAERNATSLAESFMSASHIVLVDISGSMCEHDARGGRMRWDVACEELRKLQASLQGRVAVVAFDDTSEFCPGGVPPYPRGSTNLAGALAFVMPADGTVTFIVISDGQPDDERAALDAAARMTSIIHTVYVGPEGGWSNYGAEFLQRLAHANRGKAVHADRAAELAAHVQTLMLGDGK